MAADGISTANENQNRRRAQGIACQGASFRPRRTAKTLAGDEAAADLFFLSAAG